MYVRFGIGFFALVFFSACVASASADEAECPDNLAQEALLHCQLKLYAKRLQREREFQERCKPVEYKGPGGVTYLKYTQPDCVGRILNQMK